MFLPIFETSNNAKQSNHDTYLPSSKPKLTINDENAVFPWA